MKSVKIFIEYQQYHPYADKPPIKIIEYIIDDPKLADELANVNSGYGEFKRIIDFQIMEVTKKENKRNGNDS